MDSWYIVYSKPKQELRAQQHLTNQGFDTYSPIIVTKKVRAKKAITVHEPLFPRYIFIKCVEPALLSVVRNTRGVSGAIRFGDTLATVPNELVFALIRNQVSMLNDNANESFAMGECVEILNGPFATLNGLYLQSDGLQRCIILLNFLGQELHLSVENNNLVKKVDNN